MSELTHIDADGNAVMVDVSEKDVSQRTATAKGTVFMQPATLKLISENSGGNYKFVDRRSLGLE